MTRFLTRKACDLSLFSLFVTILSLLLALKASAQVTGVGLSPVRRAIVSAHEGLVPMSSNTPLFLPVVTYDPGGFEASMIAVGDLNNDGKPDLVVVDCGDCYVIRGAGVVGVLIGNGDGTFQPAIVYGPGGVTPLFVAIADVNGDGKLDLVVANRCGNNGCLNEALVGILLGNGDGTFKPAVSYGSGGLFSQSVAVSDFNGDGRPDLAVVNACGDSDCNGTMGVLLGNGDGTFQIAVTYSSGGQTPFSVAAADVNSDGRPDLLVANWCGSNPNCLIGLVGVLVGNGNGTFQPAVTYPTGGFGASSVVVEDINGDSKPDLLVGNKPVTITQPSTVGVLLGNGDGTFQPAVIYDSGGGGWASSVAVGDVDNDAKPDLVVTNQCVANDCVNQGSVDTLLGNGNGTFQVATTYSAGGFLTKWVTVADVNGDSKPDLLVANQCADNTSFCAQSSVGVLLNNNTSAIDNTPPLITLSATPRILQPANGRLVPVVVSGTINDASGVNATNAEYAVKDEYGEVEPSGKLTLDGIGNYSITAMLRAGRRGNDLNGRRYTIRVTASDNAGNRGSKWTIVTVPHDRRK